MAYWIVYQGNSWKRARSGGYLWAPKVGQSGRTQSYWQNMTAVSPGDLIFSGVDNAVRAFSEASAYAYDSARPDLKDEQFWSADGWRLDVAYTDLPEPLHYKDWVPEIFSELPAVHSPFHKAMGPNQGYLFALPITVGEYLTDRIAKLGLDLASVAAEAAAPPPGGKTEREILSRARIGQGKFRDDLFVRWKAKCAVTEVDRPELLRASHIKPWSGCNNIERLDPCNGLLLASAYDAAFDAKLISFLDDGSLILAEDFTEEQAIATGIDPNTKLKAITEKNQSYLVAHRMLLAARVAKIT